MARPCTYTFTDQQGNEQTLGLSAFKAYLAQGGLEHFFPEKQFPWTPQFSRRGLPEKITVDGKERWTTNSAGKPIANTEEAIRNFWQWFGDSKVVDKSGRPLVVYHGTVETVSVPGKVSEGDKSAEKELKDLASHYGIADWTAVPAVIERWVENGIAEKFGASPEIAKKARELLSSAKYTISPSITELGFNEFRMPFGENELGAHFGTIQQAKAFGDTFEFYLKINSPLRLSDLGTWNYQSVIREVRRLGISISETEYDEVFYAADNNSALRKLLLSKGIDGVVYSNEAEGKGDSYIVFSPNQIKSVIGNTGQFSPENPDIRYSRPSNAPGFEVSPPQRSALWQRWFGKSRMVHNGEPIRFYHGTNADFTVFDKGRLGGATQHSTAKLGHFFTRNQDEAYQYGDKVHEVFLSVQNPYVITTDQLDQRMGDDPGRYADKLQQQGYDGIYLKDIGQAIVFNSNQAKLTSNVSPTFGEDIRYSRPEDFQKVLGEFIKDDEIFKHPVSDATTLEGVMADVAPLFTRRKSLDTQARIVGKDKDAVAKVFVSPSKRPVIIKEKDGKVWINVYHLKSGDKGGAIYAAVGNYAHNAGLEFIDDPDGVTAFAIFRRPMHMLSLALRFGTTKFLGVSDNFEKASYLEGFKPLNWADSSDSERISTLIDREINLLTAILPDLQDYYYDFETGQFKNDKLGGILPNDWADRRAMRADASGAKIGQSTIRRGVFLKSLASATGSEKSRLLEELGDDGRMAGGVSLKGIFSRQAPTAGEAKTLSTEEARQHLVDNFGVGIDNLIKQGVLNFTDGKAAWPEIAQKAARGDEEAVYINGKVYIDLRATDKSRLNSVLLHELGEHYGLRRMIGDQAYRSLQQQITNRAKIAGSRAEKIWNEVKANYGHLQEGSDQFVAEVIAKLGEYDPKAPWYRRLLTQVKAFLMRMGLARGLTAGTVTEDDLHELLKTSLKTAARGFVKDEARLYGGIEQPELAEPAYSRPNMAELKQKILRDEYGDPTLTGQAIRKLDEKWSAVAKNRFAALSVRQMVEYAAHMMPGLKKYQDLLQKREAEVSSWWRVGDRLVADVWKKLPKQEAKKLAKVMHSSTLDDVDVSKDWTGVFAVKGDDAKDISPGYFAYTQELLTPGRKAALGLEAMKRGAEQLSGNRNAEADRSNPVMYFDKRGYLFENEQDAKAFVALIKKRVEEQRKDRSSSGFPDENIKREIAHRELKPEYDSLTDPSKTVYSEANDMHNTLFDARLSELENRISDAVLNAEKRKALLAQLRAKFESGSLNWYYAPLSRFGSFWMYGTDKDGERWFKTFKTASARDEYIRDFTGPRGGKLIGSGSTLSNLEALEGKATSDSFIADVQRKIDAAGMDADTTERLKDQIYQMYLATLPDISVRHNSMRRSGVLGFEEDAMQSFAHAIHHGATQLANMKYGRDMREVLTDHKKAKELAENHSQKEKYHLENDAAEILKDRWDELSEKGALEERQLYPDDFYEEWTPKLLAAAIALRNRLGGGVTLEGEAPIKKMSQKDATEALDHIISRNEDILHAAELILAKDVDKATDVLDELTLAYDHMVNYNSGTMDQVASTINQANFIGMLGFSLSSGIVNLVQTPGVAMPVVAGKYGIEKTRKAFGQSYREFMTAVFKRKLDIDGNVSITAILDEKLAAAIKVGDGKAVRQIQDELAAMERFKDEGDISRTRSFDLLGIGQEGYAYGGRFHDFTQKAGWMFHHGERLNREVTLLSSYRLAIAEGKDSQHAIEYARFVNNRSHLDYSSENAARIFRGPLAKIALQFKKYQQGMLFLWARTAVDAWKDVKSENFADTPHGRMLFEQAKLQKKESVRTFYALMFMQASLAGALGFPMMGMVGALYKGIANALGDDDDPRELEKDLRLGLAGLIGETGAEVVTKGFFNTLTPINLASRLDQADIFFHEPMKELEGRDAAQHYVAQLFGPTGGTAEKVAQGLSYAADGYWGRAAESILPKAVSDLAKAARFSVEGAKTLDNMPLKDMSAMESLLQAWGFGSSALERKYAERGYAKEHEAAIKETRTKIMREAAWAKINGERADMAAIREWNRKHPEKPINPNHIAASVKGIKQSVEKRKERGYVVDPKLEYLYEESELMD